MEGSFITTLPGTEVEVSVLYEFTAGSPGRISGPPEDCYPPEGDEVAINTVLVDEDGQADILPALAGGVVAALEERAAEHGHEQLEAQNDDDAAEAAADREYERQRWSEYA